MRTLSPISLVLGQFSVDLAGLSEDSKSSLTGARSVWC